MIELAPISPIYKMAIRAASIWSSAPVGSLIHLGLKYKMELRIKLNYIKNPTHRRHFPPIACCRQWVVLVGLNSQHLPQIFVEQSMPVTKMFWTVNTSHKYLLNSQHQPQIVSIFSKSFRTELNLKLSLGLLGTQYCQYSGSFHEPSWNLNLEKLGLKIQNIHLLACDVEPYRVFIVFKEDLIWVATVADIVMKFNGLLCKYYNYNCILLYIIKPLLEIIFNPIWEISRHSQSSPPGSWRRDWLTEEVEEGWYIVPTHKSPTRWKVTTSCPTGTQTTYRMQVLQQNNRPQLSHLSS